MTAMARTSVLPEATSVGTLSAQLRRLRPRSATGALRRFRPSMPEIMPRPSKSTGYPAPMPDVPERRMPAPAEDVADALAFVLRFDRRKRVHNADEIMSEIVAKRLVEHLEARRLCCHATRAERGRRSARARLRGVTMRPFRDVGHPLFGREAMACSNGCAGDARRHSALPRMLTVSWQDRPRLERTAVTPDSCAACGL